MSINLLGCYVRFPIRRIPMLIMLLMTISITTIFILISISAEYTSDESPENVEVRAQDKVESIASFIKPKRGTPGRRTSGGSR